MTGIRVTCPKCHRELQGEATVAGQEVQCPTCNHLFRLEDSAPKAAATKLKVVEPEAPPEAVNEVQRLAAELSSRLTALAGIEKLEGFSLKDLFSEVFRKHSREEIEEYFTVGTASTTPALADVDTSWPKPWVFFKTFLGGVGRLRAVPGGLE